MEVKTFIGASMLALTEFVPKEVQRAAKTVPEATKRLGVEGIRKLKVEVETIVEALPDRINTELNENKLWDHRQDLDLNPHHSIRWRYTIEDYRNVPPKHLGNAIDALLRDPLKLLMSNGYGKFLLRKDSHSPSFDFSWPKTMLDPIREYQSILSRLYTATESLSGVKKEKERSEAEDIWNQA